MLCGYTNEYDEYVDKVYDNAGILQDEHIEELQDMCVSAAKKTKLDVVIVTTYDVEGKSSQEYADDFYDYNDFGYDQGRSGILMLIDLENRNVWLSTKGIAIEYFNDNDIESTLDDIFVYMDGPDYYEACKAFVGSVERHVYEVNSEYYSDLKPWFEGDYADYEEFRSSDEYKVHKEKNILSYPLVDLAIAFIAAFIVVLIMAYNQKSKMTADGSTYINKNEFKIHSSRDMFLRTTVTKVKIEESGSSGSSHRNGGSSHISRSGSSHGGGGRKF